MINKVTLLVFLGAVVEASAQTEVPNVFQSGSPARADEVNANFDALETAVDSNTSELESIESTATMNADEIESVKVRLDTIEVALEAASAENASRDAESETARLRIANLTKAIEDLGQEYGVCSARNASACKGLVSAKILGAFWQPALFYFVALDPDDRLSGAVLARPWERNIGIDTDPTDDRVKLLFGGSANFGQTALQLGEEVLVDDCDNPTVILIPTGGFKFGTLGVDNGKTFRVDREVEPTPVDVTGGTYGVLYDYARRPQPNTSDGEPPPLCAYAEGREGLRDSLPLVPQFDTSTWGEEWSLTAADPLNP